MKVTPAHTCPDWLFGLARPLPRHWAPGFLRILLMSAMMSVIQSTEMSRQSCGTPCHTLNIKHRGPVFQCARHHPHGWRDVINGTWGAGEGRAMCPSGRNSLRTEDPSSFSTLPFSTYWVDPDKLELFIFSEFLS